MGVAARRSDPPRTRRRSRCGCAMTAAPRRCRAAPACRGPRPRTRRWTSARSAWTAPSACAAPRPARRPPASRASPGPAGTRSPRGSAPTTTRYSQYSPHGSAFGSLWPVIGPGGDDTYSLSPGRAANLNCMTLFDLADRTPPITHQFINHTHRQYSFCIEIVYEFYYYRCGHNLVLGRLQGRLSLPPGKHFSEGLKVKMVGKLVSQSETNATRPIKRCV